MKRIAIPVVLILVLSAFSFAQETCGEESTELLAGQDMDVGSVTVSHDNESVYVTFTTEDGWELAETHVHIAETKAGIPATKTGNPVPGKFAYSMTHEPKLSTYTYEISLADAGIEASEIENIVIAAHSAVEKENVIVEAGYYAATVVENNQGLTYAGLPVTAARSDPAQGLIYEAAKDESSFYSLGFGGDIIVAFSCPVRDGEGDDLKIIEDTWGSYPIESADVYVSQDGEEWTLLGEADNSNLEGIHTTSSFDLSDIEGMDQIKYVKIVDTSVIGDFAGINVADGFDLNAVQALQSCIEIESESAWGEGERFVQKGNWGTYMDYDLEECLDEPTCTEGVLWQIGDIEDSQLDDPKDEFNYGGKTLAEEEPYFANPFLIGTDAAKEFPWNSNYVRGYATDLDVVFDAAVETDAKLTISWSPGRSGSEQKSIYLDDVFIGSTPVLQGTSVTGWFGGNQVYEQEFALQLAQGSHTLNLKHLMGDGTLWDHVTLESVCPQE